MRSASLENLGTIFNLASWIQRKSLRKLNLFPTTIIHDRILQLFFILELKDLRIWIVILGYHTLAYVNCENLSFSSMTKFTVLTIFAKSGEFIAPDYVRNQINPFPDRRSFYSYLRRLQRQGLLERHPDSRRGYLAYRLTPRGQGRLEYFRPSEIR
jgi:hypothetical protein